jgi:hypothetical protein
VQDRRCEGKKDFNTEFTEITEKKEEKREEHRREKERWGTRE